MIDPSDPSFSRFLRTGRWAPLTPKRLQIGKNTKENNKGEGSTAYLDLLKQLDSFQQRDSQIAPSSDDSKSPPPTSDKLSDSRVYILSERPRTNLIGQDNSLWLVNFRPLDSNFCPGLSPQFGLCTRTWTLYSYVSKFRTSHVSRRSWWSLDFELCHSDFRPLLLQCPNSGRPLFPSVDFIVHASVRISSVSKLRTVTWEHAGLWPTTHKFSWWLTCTLIDDYDDDFGLCSMITLDFGPATRLDWIRLIRVLTMLDV